MTIQICDVKMTSGLKDQFAKTLVGLKSLIPTYEQVKRYIAGLIRSIASFSKYIDENYDDVKIFDHGAMLMKEDDDYDAEVSVRFVIKCTNSETLKSIRNFLKKHFRRYLEVLKYNIGESLSVVLSLELR